MTQGTLLQYFSKTPAPTSAASQTVQLPFPSAQTPTPRTDPAADAPSRPDPDTDGLGAKDGPNESSEAPDVPTYTPVPNISQASIARVSAEHLEPLKRLTANILPVRYPDKFYNAILLESEAADLSRVVLYHGKPVGWIRCRLEPVSPESATKQIYIQALCILAPYREQGFATHLLAAVLQPELLRRYGIGSIYAHVWESNDEALEWYQRRGFKQILLVGQYYKRLKPAGAWIVRKDLGVLDHISSDG